MGSLDIASSLTTILQAVNMVQKKQDVSLTVAGSGLLSSYFKKIAFNLNLKVTFTGQLPVHKIIPYIAKAGVCLVYYDNIEANIYRSSMKLREYLAMGKKVVCNDLEEMRQFARFTYQSSSDIDSFADKIIEVLEMSDNREKQGREFITANYDIKKAVSMFYEKLTQLTNK
jgi:glycosyltransferase involved in cell wall biosynthesis